MKVETDPGYIEGQWAGKSMIPILHHTTYESIDGAIKAKETLIKTFETEFGYKREMDVEKFDYNYSYNIGMLDALKNQDRKSVV